MRLKSFLGFFANTWDRIKPIQSKRAKPRCSTLIFELLERRDLLTGVAPTIVAAGVLPVDGSSTVSGTPEIRVAYSETMSNSALTPGNYVLLGSSGNPVTIDSVAFDPTAVIPNSAVLITYNGGAPANPNAQLVVDSYTLFVKGDRLFDAASNLPIAQPGQLIVANGARNNVAVVGLPGDGTLGAISNYNLAPVGAQAANPTAVTFGDLDGDGIKDLVVIGAGTNQAMIFLGQTAAQGGGYATTPDLVLNLPTAPVNSVRKVVLADFDKDGKPDLAVTNSYASAAVVDNVSVFLNTSAATGSVAFGAGTTVDVDAVIPATPAAPVGIAAGDFDGDGNVDIAVLLNTAFNSIDADAVNDYRVAILTGDGLGGFTVPATGGTAKIKIGDTAGYGAVGTSYSLASADVTGDSKPDLIIGVNGGASPGVYVFTNVSAAPGAYSFTPVGQTYNIANVTSPGNGTILTAVKLSNGPPTSYSVGSKIYISGVTGFAAGTYTIAAIPSATIGYDFDLTGPASAIPINGTGGTSVLPTRLTTSNVLSVTTGNLDGNGLTDIVDATAANTVEVLRNLGGGSFGVASYAVAAGTGGSVRVGDLDNNGRDDIVVSNGAAVGQVTVIRNDSSLATKLGTITNITGTGSAPVSVTTAAAHNLSTGDQVYIADTGVAGFNGTFTITKTSATTFTLNGTNLLTGTAAAGSWSNRGIASVVGAAGTITVTTTTPHGLATGDQVLLSGIAGYPAANNAFIITVINPTTFTVTGTAGVANGGISSAVRAGSALTITTAAAHNLVTGDTVYLSGIAGLANANGTYVVTVTAANTFTVLSAGPAGAATPNTGTWNGTPAATFATGVAGTIASIVQTAPGFGQTTTVTTTGTNTLVTGDAVTIAGVQGLPGVNGTFTITVLSPTTFTINAVGAGGTSTPNTGTFNDSVSLSSTAYSVGSTPLGVAISTTTTTTPSDTNQDGFADVVVTNSLSNSFTLLPGNGDGTLRTGTNYSLTPTATSGVAVADLNDDGIPDIIAIANNNTSSKISVRQGLPGGTYMPEVQFTVDPNFDRNLNSLTTADINGDGKPDIIATSAADDTIVFLTNNLTPGALITAASFTSLAPNGDVFADSGVKQVVAGDFNGDGVTDLAVAHDSGGGFGGPNRGVDIFLGTTTGGVADGGFLYVNNFLNNLRIDSVVVGDFNNDGALDFIGAENNAPGNIDVEYGDGFGNFNSGGSFATGIPNIGTITATDINGDGFLDVVVGSNSTNLTNAGIAVLMNQFGTGFASPIQSDVVPGTGINSIIATDVNQDGFTDIVAATTLPKVTGTITSVSNNGGLFRITSNGHGLVTGEQVVISGSNIPSMNGTWTITVPGFGGANQFDLNGSAFVAGFAGTATWTLTGSNLTVNNNVYVLIGNGNGTFQNAVPYDIGVTPLQIAAPSYLGVTNSPLIRVTTFTSGGTIVNPDLVANGNFEARDLSGEVGNLLGWQTYDLQGQTGGSQGAWMAQSGTQSPLSGVTVPAPTGVNRAMLDEADLRPITGAFNPNLPADYAGSHALYQDITLPANATSVDLSLTLYLNSGAAFTDPTLTNPAGTLDYRTAQPNQQVRIDIMRPTAAPLSVNTAPASGAIGAAAGTAGGPIIITTKTNHGQVTGSYVTISGVAGLNAANGLFRVTVIDATHFSLDGTTAASSAVSNTGTWSVTGDVLLNVFQTNATTATTLYTTLSNIDLSAFAGQTIRLRIASANNQDKLIVGVDNVSIHARFSDTVAPTITGVAISNPSYIDGSGIAHTNDPTIVGNVDDDGGVGNLAYIEIDPTNSGFSNSSTVKITQWDVTGNFDYRISTTAAGFITVGLRVVDKAGNATTTTFTFYIQANSVTEWEPVGPQGIDVTGQFVDYTKVSGRVTTVLADSADPSGNTYFLGSVNGGVWETTNGGSTWVALMNSVTDAAGNPISVAIGGLAQSSMEPVDPLNPALGFRVNDDVLYAATGIADLQSDSRPGIGVLKSVDHGKTWTLIGDSNTVLAGARVVKVVVDANNPNVAYVGVASGGMSGPGVYKTTDGGLHWVNVLDPTKMSSGGAILGANTPLASVTDLVIDPANSNRLLVGLGNIGLVPDSATAGLWRSANNGGGWDRILGGDSPFIPNNTLPTGIGLGRVTVAIGNTRTGNEGVVYVMISTKIGNNTPPSVDFGSFAGLYKSKDNMLNWTKVMLKEDVGVGNWAQGGQVHNFQNINLFGRDAANTGSLLVDPTDPNVVYIGGSGLWQLVGDPQNHSLIRVDTGNMRDTTYTVSINPNVIPNDGDDITKAARAAQRNGFYYNTGGATPTYYDPYSKEGVYWYDVDQGSSGTTGQFDYLPEEITSLGIDSQGRLLVGTDGGIWRGVSLGFGYDTTSGGTGIMTVGGGGGGGGGGFAFFTPGMNFTSINGNLSISDISSVAIDPLNRGVFFTTQYGTGVAGSTAPLVWVSQGLTGPMISGGVLEIPNASAVIAGSPAFGAPAGTPVTLYRLWQYADTRALQPEISLDDGVTWQAINSTGISVNIPASMFPAFTIDQTSQFLNGQYRNALAFGTQLVYISETDGAVWDPRSPILSAGAAISALAFAPSTGGVLYAATSDGKVFYTSSPGPATTDWPQRNTASLPAVNIKGVYVHGITVDPNDSNTAYLMYGDGGSINEVQTINVPATATAIKLTYNGNTTAAITYTGTPATDQAAISAALNLPAILGAGGTATVVALGGGSFSITYGGTLAATDLPQITGAVTSGTGNVAVGTQTNGTGTNFDHVYVTTDAGLTWNPVGSQAISAGGLPKVPAYSMVIDRNPSLGAPNGKMYLATEVGVFVSLNNGTTWSRLGAGMPNVPVVDLQLDTDRLNPDGSTSTGLHVLAAATLGRGVYTINTAAFSFIPDQTVDEDTPTSAIPVTINDPTGTASYTLAVSSDNLALVPLANIVVGGSGVNRTIMVTPAANMNDINSGGPAHVTLTLTSGTFTYSQTFTVSVTAVNDLPTVTPIGTQSIFPDSVDNTFDFTVDDVETPPAAIIVTATSGDQTLIPNSGITVTAGTGGARTLHITPAANQIGSTQITVRVDDGTIGGIVTYVFDILVSQSVNISSTPFTDDFSRPDNSVFLGPGWNVTQGEFDLVSGEAVAIGNGFNAVVLNGLSTSDAAVEADVNLPAGAVTYEGVMARSTGTGASASYYWGTLINVNGVVYAQIYRNINGVFQAALSSQVVAYVPGTTARLRFEVSKDSLKLFLNDALVGYANDTLFSAPGTFGIVGGPGSTFDNFSATALTATNVTVPDTEAFDSAPPRNQLSSDWRVVSGAFTITGTGPAAAATGVGPTNMATLNVATPQTDGFVQANATVNGTTTSYVGLVARYNGDAVNHAGFANFYTALFMHVGGAGGPTYVQLYSNINGTFTLLSSTPVNFTSALIRMEVIADSLKVYANGVLVGYANDVNLASGSYGMWVAPDATVDNFNIGTIAASSGTLEFQDNFDGLSDGDALPLPWINHSGNFSALSSAVQAQAAGYNIAGINGINAADVYSQADVTLAAGEGALTGVIARANFVAGNVSYYLGALYRAGGVDYAIIIRMFNGAGSIIAMSPVAASSGSLRLEVVGDSLQLLFNGSVAAWGNDAAPLGAGSVGIWSTQNGTEDDFDADVIALNTPTLTFSEDFNAYADGAPLGLNWVNHAGMLFASAGAMVSQSAFNVSTLGNFSQGDVSVQADITLDTTAASAFAGVIARYNSTASGANYYTALLVRSGATYTVQIYRVYHGAFALLSQADVTSAYVPGASLRLDVAGDSLKVFFNGVLTTYANDEILTSVDGGSAGLISTMNQTSDNFMVTDNPLVDVTIPPLFVDDFNGADQTELSANWLNRVGNFSTLGDAITGNAALNLATLNGVSLGDVSINLNGITLGAAVNSLVGAVARYTGSGASTYYWAGLVQTISGPIAAILRFQNGAGTVMVTHPVASATGNLQFNIVGSTLQLLQDTGSGFQLVASVGDAAPLSAGTAGIMTTPGGTIDQFQMQDTDAVLSNVPPAFTDALGIAQGNTIDITQWNTSLGGFIGTGAAVAGLDAANIAVLRQTAIGDTSVQANVNVDDGGLVGLFARSSGAPFVNSYFAALYRTGSITYALLFKFVNGSAIQLASQVISSSSGLLTFDVIGDTLRLYLDGTSIATAFDSTFASGSVGIYASRGNSLDSFSVDTLDPPTLPVSDSFNGTALGSDPSVVNWGVRAGGFSVASNAATGATPNDFSFATVVGLSAADVDISATASLAANQGVALSARFTPGNGYGTQYFAYLYYNGSSYVANIYLVSNGSFVLLKSQNVGAFAGQIRFQVTGSNLILSLDSVIVINMTDTSITGPGSVGMTSFNGGSLSNFQAN